MRRWAHVNQPSYPVHIDWGNPITRGLTFAWIATNHLRNMVDRRIVSSQPGVVKRGQSGIAFCTTSGGINQGLDFGLYQPISSSTDFEIQVYAAPGTNAGRKAAFSQRYGSSGIEQIDFLFGTNGSFVDGSAYFTLFLRNTAGTNFFADNRTGLPGAPDGTWHLWGASVTATQPQTWKDGAQNYTDATSTSGTLVSTNQKTRIGNIGDYTVDGIYSTACPIAMVLVWGARALQAHERYILARNPWQIFAPQRALWFGQAAAAAGGFFSRYYYDMPQQSAGDD